MRMNKRLYTVIAVTGSLALFTACGKAKKDDIAHDFESIGIDVGTDTEDVSMPNELDYVIQSASGDVSITVSAKVDTDSLASAAVYDVGHTEMNEEYLKQLADRFFEGDYSYIKIYEHCSLEELEQEQAFYNQLADEYGDNVYSYADYYREKINTLLNDYNESGTLYTTHSGLMYHNDQWSMEDSFFDDIVEDTEFRITAADYSRLRGEVEGHIYELYFEKYYTEGKPSSAEIYAQYDPERVIIRCVDTPYYVKRSTDMGGCDSNVCDYATALSQAEDAVEKLGFRDWEVMNTYQLDIATSADMTYIGLNGYEFWFTPKQNGKYVFDCKGKHMVAFGSEHDSEWIYGTGQPLLRVLVTDYGIYEIDIGDIYSESDSEGKKAELMPFEKIDEIAKEYMGKYHITGNIEITDVKLGYIYISYDGINYSLVPIWAYCYEDGNAEKALVYINALDGELVCRGNEKIIVGYHPITGDLIQHVLLSDIYD